jgi:hypothetical protein
MHGDRTGLRPAPAYSRHAGRAAFKAIYVGSLVASAEQEIGRHRSRRRPVRRHLAERRLARLQASHPGLRVDPGRATPAPWAALWLASAVWLANATGLAINVATRGLAGTITALTELAMLLLTALWFALAIACTPARAE